MPTRRIAATRLAWLLAGFLTPGAALAQTITPLNVDRVARNTTVEIRVTPVPDDASQVGFVKLVPGEATPTCASSTLVLAPAAKTAAGVSFVVPATLPAAQYLLCLVTGTARLPVPMVSRPFEIVNAGTVTITNVEPAVAYAGGTTKAYKLFVEGTNFSPVPEDNILLVRGRQILPDCKPRCTTGYLPFVVNQKPGANDPPEDIIGKVMLHLTVLGGGSSEMHEVTLASTSPELTRVYALGTTLGLIAIVIVLIVVGLKAAGNRLTKKGITAALLLGDDGQSYSLSKFQFLLWTVVAVGGYVFLALAWSLIQGKFDLPPVPEGLPGIIGISGVTALTAVAASEARGPKGGGQKPSVGDFIMVGGKVAPERLQFFVWTLVSILAFVVAVGAADPGVVESLPRIPDGLLFLMGISAAGYLGGKFIRRPAPVLTALVATAPPGELIIEAEGRHLSDSMRVLVDGVLVASAGSGGTAPGDPTVSIAGKDPEDDSAESGQFKKATLTIANPRPEWTQGEHRLEVVNPDGQSATKKFTPNQPPRLFM